MEYRNLGNSGLKVSVLAFGYSTTGIDINTVRSAEYEQLKFESLSLCIKNGINFFDTAEIYSAGLSEIILGKNLKQGGWDRDELVISTKLHCYYTAAGLQGLSRKRVRVGVKNSLQRLQLDTVDILYYHKNDCSVPLKEQVSIMNESIENEKIYYWGTVEYSPEELLEIFKICDKYGYIPPISEQCQYNMLYRKYLESDYVPLFDHYKLGTAIFSPAAGGLLAGRFNNGTVPQDSKYAIVGFFLDPIYQETLGWRKNNGADMLQQLKQIADDLGCTQVQLATAWTLYNKDVSTSIIGVKRPEHILDNIQALSVLKKLTPEILEKIEVILNNRPTPPINFRTFTIRDNRR